MKTIFLLVASVILHTAALAQSESRTLDSSTSFGRYMVDCSSGRGVCSFGVSSNGAAKAIDTRIATKLSDISFKMTIFTSVITINDEIRIAGKPFSQITVDELLTFIQQEVMTVDAATLNNLLLDPGRNKINPAMYPLAVFKDRVEIIFTLSH